MDIQMSVADIIKSAAGLEIQEFENLYKKLSALRLQKRGIPLVNEAESKLLKQINQEFSEDKWERLQFLDWKTEFSALNETEEAEALKLAEAYEDFSVERIKSLAQLATLRNIHIDELMEQLGLKSVARG